MLSKAKHFAKELFEHFFAIQLPCAAERAVPGQFFIQVVAQKIENIQTHFCVANNFAVAVQVF